MAIFKANYVKRGRDATKRAKASIRYIQNRGGKDGEKISRTLFNQKGAMDRYEAYSIIDDAPKKGTYFYRFIIAPTPNAKTTTTIWTCATLPHRQYLPLRNA
jgi:hypothetical protein